MAAKAAPSALVVAILAQVATSDQACSNTVSCSVTEGFEVGLLTRR